MDSNDMLAYIAECIEKCVMEGEGSIIDLELQNPTSKEIVKVTVSINIEDDTLPNKPEGSLLH